jgi:hypothetical protein
LKFGAPNKVVRLKRSANTGGPRQSKLGQNNGGWRNAPIRSMMPAKRVRMSEAGR